MSYKNRHHWKHHYPGTQGVILNFCFDLDENLFEDHLKETLEIIFDISLKSIPLLIVFEPTNKKMINLIESLRTEVNSRISGTSRKVNFLSLISINDDFKLIIYGLEWLCDVMEALSL